MADDVAPEDDETQMSGIAANASPADGNRPSSPNAPAQRKGSKFLPPKSAADSIKDALNIKTLDPHLEEMLKDVKTREARDKKSILIDLEDGATIKADSQSIGLAGRGRKIDEKTAEVMASLAKARGWHDVSVSGSREEKENLWLEAQRHGLQVVNFKPDPDSDIAKKWEHEKTHGRDAKISQAPETDFHVKTMQLLKDKVEGVQDKDLKSALATVLKKFTEGHTLGDEKTLAAISEALSDKHSPRAGYNLMADILNKADPTLAIAKLDDASVPANKPAMQATKTPSARTP